MRRTERRNPRTRGLDLLSVPSILACIHAEDARVAPAVRRVTRDIARAVELVVGRFVAGGRLLLVGAGTSGRLAALEAAECPPTFGTPPSLVRAVVAGGSRALTRGVEGAEDDAKAGARAMKSVGARDAVIGIAASGTTPFVRAALAAAKSRGAATILLACNPSPKLADVHLTPDVGAEVIAGSTRLKAGTATKLILNAITIAAMTRVGKVYDNVMVDVQPTNMKLRDRATRIVSEVAGASPNAARAALTKCGWRPKTAIVMLRRRCTRERADHLLLVHGGHLRGALA